MTNAFGTAFAIFLYYQSAKSTKIRNTWKGGHMSIISFIHKSTSSTPSAPTTAQGGNESSPQLISEEANLVGVNDEFNQYLEYYMDQIRMKSKGCVLIVEDDVFCRMIIESAVREYSLDIKITAAVSEQEALQILKESPCDLVISDYYLEGTGTGLDLCKEILSKYPNTKCLMMSSMNFPQYKEVVADSKLSPEFMEKPIKPSLIKKYLTSFFEERFF